MSKPRALPDRPGIIQHGCGSNIRDRDERSRSGCHRLCGSVLRRGKRRRELPKKKKQVQVSGEQRRKTTRQV